MDKQRHLNNIQHNLSYFGSNTDIANALSCSQDTIIKYSELKNYKTLTDLLPKIFDYKIILLETAKNSGHWTCIIRMNNIVECFNSYGISIDKEFKFIPDVVERMLGESKKYLTDLINKTKDFTVISNKYKFQSQDPSVATCSRWVILRIETARIGYSLQTFVNMIQKQVDRDDIPSDILVLYYVRFPTDRKI